MAAEEVVRQEKEFHQTVYIWVVDVLKRRICFNIV
jgi:hypothetical protein